MESKVESVGVVAELHEASDLSKENARLKQQVESLQALLLGPPPQHSPGTRLRRKARRLSAPARPEELKVRSFPAPVAELCELRSGPPSAQENCEVRSGRPSVVAQVDCDVRSGRPSVVPQVECEARPCRPSVVPQVECRPTRSPRMSTSTQMECSEVDSRDFAWQPSEGPSDEDDEEDAETDCHGDATSSGETSDAQLLHDMDATSIGEALDAQMLKGMDLKYRRPPEGHWSRRDNEGGACGCQVQ